METKPFIFYTRLNLTELTGLKASTLGELLELIKTVPSSCIYHHTHRFLLQHQYLSPEPPNDFAYWASEVIKEEELGEDLASIDTIGFSNFHDLRREIVSVVEKYLKKHPDANNKYARRGEEFHFIKSVGFISPTNHIAHDMNEFLAILKVISLDSIYFHIFDSRLRLERGVNDFSKWFEEMIGDKSLADKVSRLDPYTYTLDDLRNTIVKFIERRIKK